MNISKYANSSHYDDMVATYGNYAYFKFVIVEEDVFTSILLNACNRNESFQTIAYTVFDTLTGEFLWSRKGHYNLSDDLDEIVWGTINWDSDNPFYIYATDGEDYYGMFTFPSYTAALEEKNNCSYLVESYLGYSDIKYLKQGEDLQQWVQTYKDKALS